jgi:hypothetical protein
MHVHFGQEIHGEGIFDSSIMCRTYRPSSMPFISTIDFKFLVYRGSHLKKLKLCQKLLASAGIKGEL